LRNDLTFIRIRSRESAAFGGRCRLDGGARRRDPAVDLKALHAKIGELTLENDFLEGALGKAGVLSAKR
jgi:hypothetical protein